MRLITHVGNIERAASRTAGRRRHTLFRLRYPAALIMFETLKKRFEARDNTRVGGMFVKLELETRLFAHDVLKERQQK